MKVNLVKQFVASNVSRFKKIKCEDVKTFHLYDKNNAYCGEYRFQVLGSSGLMTGAGESLSTTKILDKNLNPKMQEIVHMQKDLVKIKDKSSEFLVKLFPQEITTTKTVLDFEKDRFETVRTVSKLQNKLQKIGDNDPDFRPSKNNIIYEELKEKPKYEKVSETIREGSISDVKTDVRLQKAVSKHSENSLKIPYIYW